MNFKPTERWTRISATCGVAIWAALAGLAGGRKAPLGVIELLFLFAPLVVVPLALELGKRTAGSHLLVDAASILQPYAAGLAVLSFWCSPGRLAAALVAPWLLLCVLLAVAGFLSIVRRKEVTLAALAVNIGRIDMAVAGAWLLASRLGLRPMGIQEPIGLLTAIHFHYTGLATATLAAALVTFAKQHGYRSRLLNSTVLLVLLVPFVIAAGFVFSVALKMIAALLLSVSVVMLAAHQFWLARKVDNNPARQFLRFSALTVAGGMVLAGTYAIGDAIGQDWLVIPRMASTHGLLNGLGFVLCGLLGWLAALPSGNNEFARVHDYDSQSDTHDLIHAQSTSSQSGVFLQTRVLETR